ncbi:MAG: hypothetical protein PUC39_00295 [Lachnospiraceae bacterium]|nr:hypothetical protein [Lachnospiraceae bacterium]
MRRFWHTNREYCQLVYEHTGVWADRAAYATDNTEYYLYYEGEKAEKIRKAMPAIQKAVAALEGAQATWMDSRRCLFLWYSDEK